MYGYIYKTTNLINNKIYIGQHISASFDLKYFGSGIRIVAALKKYGKENFHCEILEECASMESLNDREFYWINHFQSCNPEIGYNIKLGGNNAPHSEEIKQKISKGNKGKKRSPEYIEQMRQRQIGNHNNGGCNKGRVKMHKGSDQKFVTPEKIQYYLSQGYTFGVSESTTVNLKAQAAEKYGSGSYMNKDGEVKYFAEELIPELLEEGWNLGKGNYPPERGANVSKGKKGAVKIINKEGQVKYVSPEKLSLYIDMGFERTHKN